MRKPQKSTLLYHGVILSAVIYVGCLCYQQFWVWVHKRERMAKLEVVLKYAGTLQACSDVMRLANDLEGAGSPATEEQRILAEAYRESKRWGR